jgi:hypothetical protein
MGQMMMCTLCMSNYYLYVFIEIINNEKGRKVMVQVCIFCRNYR